MSNWSLCLLCSILFNFSETKCISKSQRKLMNYKSENRIPWLFTDFDNIKDFPWLFKKFPDFSLTLKSFAFSWLFPDRGNSVYCTDFLPCILKFYADQLLVFYWLQVQVQFFSEEILFASCLWRKLNYFRKAFLKRSMESFAFGLG